MPAKKVEAKITKPSVSKATKLVAAKVEAPVYSLTSDVTTTMALPESIFGAKVNKTLINQAIRVYLNNTKSHWSNTKTRSQVAGSTRKLYQQKGTGRARQGSIRAPHRVHGGIALGPTSRKVRLDLPQKMKSAALISSLSEKSHDGQVIVADFASASGKTAQMSKLFKKINQGSYLVVVDPKAGSVVRSLRNLPEVSLLSAENLNAFEVIRHKSLVLTKEAITKLEERLVKKETK